MLEMGGPDAMMDTFQAESAETIEAESTEAAVDGEVIINGAQHPEAAQHIEDAQAAGQPSVITIDRAGAATRRQQARTEHQHKAAAIATNTRRRWQEKEAPEQAFDMYLRQTIAVPALLWEISYDLILMVRKC
jgi:hypothetical protein